MAEINHKWTTGEDGVQTCKRCGRQRKQIGKSSFAWLISGEWKNVRTQPSECDPMPRSLRGTRP